ncbi:Beta-galactosidase-1-like protein 2 [Orchesella cincta]|uniref:Beta-galactosidase n=1 Tax=Orchesella cincta TaxID=48709 RepID=A0A1D2MYS8_ORCCI|nr:Beta-galactosidase-1-like protein 2 [Orchesella cincta]
MFVLDLSVRKVGHHHEILRSTRWTCHCTFLTQIMFSKLVLACSSTTFSQDLPSVYEYFGGTERTGLVAGNRTFTLNAHYQWSHPLFPCPSNPMARSVKEASRIGEQLCLTATSPLDLHEPRKGNLDFGNGTNDFSEFMNVRKFIQTAQEEDLLVLIRPGPYICTEWDFGGMPSWLQRDPEMKVRENNKPYLDRVKIYLDNFLPQVADLQFTRGGPIIAVQIENEYGSFSPRSSEYLQFVRDLYNEHGLDESLHFTSDNGFGGNGMEGSLPGVLQTANFQNNPSGLFNRLREVQPDMPTMAMEFWAGWFNHWGDDKQAGTTPENMAGVLEEILRDWNGSVNFYMFFGGTNFGFMAGGNNLGEHHISSSYDYDAPLSEAGDYTRKYDLAAELIERYQNPQLRKPDRPAESTKAAYPTLGLERYLTYSDIIERVPSTCKFQMERPVSMENLPMNGDSGQSFGYVIYRKNVFISPNDDSSLRGSWPRDVGFLLVDGELVQDGSDVWINSIKEFPLSVTQAGNHTVDLMVEPLTRVNFGGAGDFIQQKGIAPIHQSKIEINGEEVTDVEIIAAEFTNAWVKNLEGFREVQNGTSLRAPVLLQSSFNIEGEPADTWLDMSRWSKGAVYVNGFNIGRYWKVGPQQNLYVPAPLLKTGENIITIFEQVQPHNEITFSDRPNLGAPPSS